MTGLALRGQWQPRDAAGVTPGPGADAGLPGAGNE